MSNDENWLKQFYSDYNTDNIDSNYDQVCSCRDYNYADLSILNKKYIQKFYKIGSKSLKCNHYCENEQTKESLCKSIESETYENDDCLIIQKTNNVESREHDLFFKSNLNILFISLIIISFCLIFIQISYLLFIITILISIFIVSQNILLHKKILIEQLNLIKMRYFYGNFYLFYLTLALISLLITKVLLSIFLYFFSVFYFIIPKSEYFYLSNLLAHLISFDYPELVEYHEKYYFCYDYKESC
jgi:hypothetical protein